MSTHKEISDLITVCVFSKTFSQFCSYGLTSSYPAIKSQMKTTISLTILTKAIHYQLPSFAPDNFLRNFYFFSRLLGCKFLWRLLTFASGKGWKRYVINISFHLSWSRCCLFFAVFGGKKVVAQDVYWKT